MATENVIHTLNIGDQNYEIRPTRIGTDTSKRTIAEWDDDREMELLEGYDIQCAKAEIHSEVICYDTIDEGSIKRFDGHEGKLLFTDISSDAYIKGRHLIYTDKSGVSTDTNHSALTYVAGTHYFCVGNGGDSSDSNTAPTKILSIYSNAIAPAETGTINVGTTAHRFNHGYFKRVHAAEGFFEPSDERLKTFVKPISADLDKLSALRKSYFYWKDNNDNLQLGVSAQEIQKLYPELVTETENGYLTVAYDKLSVVALAAIDNLTAKNKELEDRLLKLEDIVNKYCLN